MDCRSEVSDQGNLCGVRGVDMKSEYGCGCLWKRKWMGVNECVWVEMGGESGLGREGGKDICQGESGNSGQKRNGDQE